ncbi:unnamed protein product [Gordionus sp. m RMFG-2023]|uniref:translocation protein SEC62-like isoform X2 n=1 Tax=Gordionus sp. m RMFG-2023 TaxID=3053472 RepID=UPI0030E45174
MEKKKSKHKKEILSDEPSKQDNKIARYLRFKIPSKKANMFGSKVQYFTANKAIDTMMASKWATGKAASDISFTSREAVIEYLNTLLYKNFFHRVRKFIKILEIPDEKSNNESNKINNNDGDSSTNEKKAKHEDANENEPSKNAEEIPDKNTNLRKRNKKSSSDNSVETKKKKDKKKVKLELHETQAFVEGNEQFYVWVYDPVPIKTWILGFFIVIGAIVICLFPLWPMAMRSGVYYLSLAGAGFLGVILFLALMRYVIFGAVWTMTLGTHHVWFLPNLLEDVGFVESFIPLYTHKKCHSASGVSKSKKSKTTLKNPDSDKMLKDSKDGDADDNKDAKGGGAGDYKEDDFSNTLGDDVSLNHDIDIPNKNGDDFEMIYDDSK